jgi:hypothetical protein
MTEQFVGTWKLRSMTRTTDDGSVIHPFGASPVGYLTYTGDGRVFVILTKADRPTINVSLEELLNAKKTKKMFFSRKYLSAVGRLFKASTECVSYYGTYEVKDSVVAHHIDVSLFPDWMGATLERSFSFADRRLTLRTRAPQGEVLELVWEPVPGPASPSGHPRP